MQARGRRQGHLFDEIPNIPRYGQRVEDIGLFKREDLLPTHNLKAVFRSIRNYLAANAVGMTRDEPLAQQIMNLIFCKIYDERFTRRDTVVTFRVGVDEPVAGVAARVKESFARVVRQYNDVFDMTDTIELDDRSITYVVGELQQYCLIECERDVVGDASETFIGPSLKGGQGQFFTPRNVTHLVRALVRPKSDDMVLDPACGSGGFLVEALRGLWDLVDDRAGELQWPRQRAGEREAEGRDPPAAGGSTRTSSSVRWPRPTWRCSATVAAGLLREFAGADEGLGPQGSPGGLGRRVRRHHD